jgi:hypothetical protein
MKRAYLLVYNTEFGTRDAARRAIDAIPEITNWRAELPSAFYLVSDLDAGELGTLIRAASSYRGKYLLVEVTSNKQGWLDKKSWTFLNERPDPAQRA